MSTAANKVLRVISTREGFRRAGFTFGREPVDIPLDTLKKAQLEAITSDPALVTLEVEIEVKAEAETAAKPARK